jgi:hypothetical protein
MQTPEARSRSIAEWFQDLMPTASGDQAQDIRWYFNPLPDGGGPSYS